MGDILKRVIQNITPFWPSVFAHDVEPDAGELACSRARQRHAEPASNGLQRGTNSRLGRICNVEGDREISTRQPSHDAAGELQVRGTNSPGEACLSTGHLENVERGALNNPRKRHRGVPPRGTGVGMEDEVEQQHTSPHPQSVSFHVPSHQANVSSVRSHPLPSVLFPNSLSVATQVTPHLQARNLSRQKNPPSMSHIAGIPPLVASKPPSEKPPSSGHLPPVQSMHDYARDAAANTPAMASMSSYRPSILMSRRSPATARLSHPSTGLSGPSTAGLPTNQDMDDDVVVLRSSRPVSSQGSKRPLWDFHLRTYEELDASWPQEQARIEAQDAERWRQVQETLKAEAEARKPKMEQLQEMLARGQRESVEHELRTAQLIEVEQERLGQLAIAQQRGEIVRASMQARRRPQRQPAGAPAPQVPAVESPEEEGVVDLLDSSDEEGREEASAGEAQAEGDGVVCMISSSEDDAQPETEESDDEMEPEEELEEELNLDGTGRVLTPALQKEYQRLLTELVGFTAVATHDRENTTVSAEDLKLCAPGQWLGDNCINLYMSLLQDRDLEARAAGNAELPKCIFMNSHFVSKLCQEQQGYTYDNVRRWTGPRKLKKIQLLDNYAGIKDIDKLVMPVHLGNHWTCAVLNFRDCQLEYYDSLNGTDNSTIKALLQWVKDEYADKYKGPLPERFQTDKWKRVINPQGTPKQRNGHDCGVFAIMCCNYVGADRPFDYGQDEVHSFFRAMCAIECSTMRLRSLDA